MSVYVDNMRRTAQLTGRPAKWSHLMADSTEELLAFADTLGLRREWLQHAGTHREHFDVTEANRKRALLMGARPITYPHQTGELLARKRQASKR